MPISRRLLFPASTTSSKRVFTEVQGRWRSFAASVPSDEPTIRRRRIPKEERKVMVESFVDRYRATNMGSFPSITMAHKEVGGSYYIIKRIIEELKAEAKMSSIGTTDNTSQHKEPTKNKPSTEHGIASSKIPIKSAEIEEVPSSQIGKEKEPLTDCEHIAHTQIEELKAEAKMSSIGTTDNTSQHKEPTKNKPSTEHGIASSKIPIKSAEIEEVPSSQIGKEKEPLTDCEHIAHTQIEELKAEAKMSSIGTTDNTSQHKEPTKNKPSTEHGIASSKIPITSAEIEEVSSSQIGKESEPLTDCEHIAHTQIEELKAEAKMSSIGTTDNTSQQKPEQKDQPDLDKLSRDMPQWQEDEELRKSESQKEIQVIQQKPSMWGNLKSLADGIINIWRKL